MKKWQALGSAAALLAALLLEGCSGQQAAATPEQAAHQIGAVRGPL